MKRVAIVLFLFVAAVAVAVGALAVFPPKELVKSRLAKEVKEATGRELAINGPMSLRLLPRVVMRLEDVELKNVSGPPRDPLLAAQAVLVDTELWPLLMGRRIIDTVSLEAPRLALSNDLQAQPSPAGGQSGGQPLQVRAITVTRGVLTYRDGANETAHVAAIDGSAQDLIGDKVGQLSMKAGEATFRTASGPVLVLKTVDADAKAVGLETAGELTVKAAKASYRKDSGATPIELDGPQASAKSLSRTGALETAIALLWNGERVNGSVRLQSPGELAGGKPSPVLAKLEAPKGKLDIDATLSVAAGGANINGKAVASAPSFRAFAGWAGFSLPKTGAFGPARAEGNLKVSGSVLAFDSVQIVLDETKANGNLTLDLGRPKPFVSGHLKADAIDVDSYFDAAPAPAQAKKKSRLSDAPATSPPALPPGTEKDALKSVLRAQLEALDTPAQDAVPPNSEADRMRVAKAPSQWPDDPIDVSGLKTFDADLGLSVAKLTIGGVEVGLPELKAALKGGALALDIKSLAVEGATVTGTASVNAADSEPKISAKFVAHGVDPRTLFEALGQEARITGKSTLEADLSGSGASQRKLIETLSGRVKAVTSKGAIVGYDLNSLWGLLTALTGQYSATSRTPFDELAADMTLANGVSSTSSVEVEGTILAVNGKGVVRLPSREIDYRARLSLLSWGQSAAVHILGGWVQPKINYSLGTLGAARIANTERLEMPNNADLKDPELARLADEVLKKGATKGALSPQVTAVIEQIKARAEGR